MKIQEVHGTFSSAVIYTADDPLIAVDAYALAQIKMICDHRASEGSQIRIMPDVHPGKVGPIGLAMTITDRILPQLVGIDIGCGMTVARLCKPKVELQQLDSVIKKEIPSGFDIHSDPKAAFDLDDLHCVSHIRQDKALCSLGTLGGGNHFIELDEDEDKNVYIIIHSGSRHLGKEVAEYYCREGQRCLKEQGISEPYETTWLEGDLMKRYLHDVQITQAFASLNRSLILKTILKKMKWKISEEAISCIHNYVDSRDGLCILRKGAISARSGEPAVIPVHMKDGVILGKGKGNPDWNYSAPHGSGRLYKREDVQKMFTLSAYKKIMHGIYTSCVNRSTLDESPFCYRNLSDIQDAIQDCVSIDHILKPIYNYKDSSEKAHVNTD